MRRSLFAWVVWSAIISTVMSLSSLSVQAQPALQGQEYVTAAVQDALVWTGHYNLLHDGKTGAQTLTAISAFQRQQGWPVTGSLEDAQKVRLLEIAHGLRERAGFREVTDQRSGVTIGLPLALVSYFSETPNGSRYRSHDGQIELRLVRYDAREKPLRALYEEVRGQYTHENRPLDRAFSDRFFVSGASDRRVFYYSARQFGGDVKGFTFSYPPELKSVVGPIIVAMGNSFKAPIIDYVAVARQISSVRPSVASVDPQAKSPSVAGYQKRAETWTEANRAEPRKSGGTGTGFAVSSQGHILTNSHVVTNCSEIVVLQPGGQQHKARVVARDPKNDLALLLSTAKPDDVAAFRSGVRVGEAIAAYGFPYAGLLPSTGNFTTGTVTASTGLRDDTRMVQISSPVQPGNSGGPLVDQAGNVVGVIVSKLNALLVASITDDVPQNVNFAIRSGIATTFLEASRVDFRTATAQAQLAGADLAERSRRITWFVACLPQE